jgi:hypothetical protein
MKHNSSTNGQKISRSFVVYFLGLAVLFGLGELTAPQASIAAPNTGGAQKTRKQCKDDRTKCEKNCGSLIDIDNHSSGARIFVRMTTLCAYP